MGGDGARTRVVTGDQGESAMMVEERCCTAQAVDHSRHQRLPALEVLRVRSLWPSAVVTLATRWPFI